MYKKAALVVLVLFATAFDSPPTTIAARTTAAPPVVPLAPPACQLNYYGGKVLENVVVYAVNWGSGVSSTVVNSIGGFYSAFTGSAMFDWLSEYNTVGLTGLLDGKAGSNQGISHGTFGGSYTITPGNTATTLTDTQIQTELAAQLAAGKLPAPTLSADGDVTSIYMIEFPFGIKITNGGSSSCAIGGFCAYHGTITYSGKSVPYGVLPDMMNPSSGCFTGCGTNTTQFNNVTSVHSHELVEAVTDMEIGLSTTVKRPLAWYSPTNGCGEIGDICNAQQGSLAGYTVQKEWSNAAGACIVSKPTLPPICTGPSTPAGCRVCTAADDGFACSGATPHCETDSTNLKYGTCVACTASAQCSGATPICGKSSTTASADDVCRACTNADCSGATPACETMGTFAGQCVQCTSGNTAACMGGAGTLCDPATDHCVQCVVDGDCMASDQCHAATCSPTTHTCGQTALTGTTCSDGDACTTGDTCQAGTCMPGSPKTCAAIDQCHGAGTCNSANGTCSTPPLADNTPCSDGDACTVNDTCQAGVCTSGAAARCAAGDECHDAATCSMMTGCGSPTAKPDGTACSLGQCQGGVCTAASMSSPDMTMMGGGDLGGAVDAGDGADLGGDVGGDDLGGNHASGSGGCSCELSGRATPPPWGALVVVAAALALRRRRAR